MGFIEAPRASLVTFARTLSVSVIGMPGCFAGRTRNRSCPTFRVACARCARTSLFHPTKTSRCEAGQPFHARYACRCYQRYRGKCPCCVTSFRGLSSL
jgi:hypothetical protein